jgi:thioredoxin 1
MDPHSRAGRPPQLPGSHILSFKNPAAVAVAGRASVLERMQQSWLKTLWRSMTAVSTAEILQSDKPAMVDFWAPWCGPCKAIGPVISDLAGTFGDRLKFSQVQRRRQPDHPGQIWESRPYPTLIFFKDGDRWWSRSPAWWPKSKLEEAIKKGAVITGHPVPVNRPGNRPSLDAHPKPSIQAARPVRRQRPWPGGRCL